MVAVIVVAQDSESKNSGGQKLLMEEKQEDSNPSLKIVSLVSDAVHVGKVNDKVLATGSCG